MQLDAVVNELYNRSGKWPLVVLHNKRVCALLKHSSHQNLVQVWIDKDLLYTTPNGSNDDWYKLPIHSSVTFTIQHICVNNS